MRFYKKTAQLCSCGYVYNTIYSTGFKIKSAGLLSKHFVVQGVAGFPIVTALSEPMKRFTENPPPPIIFQNFIFLL